MFKLGLLSISLFFLGFIAFAIVSRFAVFSGFSKAVFFVFLERILY
jgi:hypothetical protein